MRRHEFTCLISGLFQFPSKFLRNVKKNDKINIFQFFFRSYCERLDIKPLSTADFGKVMKQVFPDVRPRRLGTRGNSRYCYAAMRKTTKLYPPILPTLGKVACSEETNDIYHQSLDEECWKPIKVWSEGLLNTTFKNISDLSTHIQKHQLNTSASNSSRNCLQKKLYIKELKEKKKYAVSSLRKHYKTSKYPLLSIFF